MKPPRRARVRLKSVSWSGTAHMSGAMRAERDGGGGGGIGCGPRLGAGPGQPSWSVPGRWVVGGRGGCRFDLGSGRGWRARRATAGPGIICVAAAPRLKRRDGVERARTARVQHVAPTSPGRRPSRGRGARHRQSPAPTCVPHARTVRRATALSILRVDGRDAASEGGGGAFREPRARDGGRSSSFYIPPRLAHGHAVK